jgi:hypothetical protein
MKKTILLLNICLFFLNIPAKSQIKLLVEDFEGLAYSQSEFSKEGMFAFGSAGIFGDSKYTTGKGYSGNRLIRVDWSGKEAYGGWGKGISKFIELDQQEDYINFYVYSPSTNSSSTKLKILIEEDDNNNHYYEYEHDDSWFYILELESKDEWQLISLPLKDFQLANTGGDHIFNIGYKTGKIFSIIMSFIDIGSKEKKSWYFDFICFTKGKIKTSDSIFSPVKASEEDFCFIGAWSDEGNEGKFLDIALNFEKTFNSFQEDKKLVLIHFFNPFSTGNNSKELFPSVPQLNKLISKGYTPMITMENHYVKVSPNHLQPNLYSIVEGHFDFFFTEWAKRIRQVDGIVLLRLLHEFNGDWYHWSLPKNNHDPQLYISAFRHIHQILKKEQAENVRFIWCPNSMSIPQAEWNYIMDAYPGDDYVDFVGLDIYNGAGEKNISLWRSFRKEASENYYLLTSLLPNKPLLICEVASRERKPSEKGKIQDKAEWIEQMSEALQSDMSKIRLVTWFNEYNTFKINSSENSKNAFIKHIWSIDYFRMTHNQNIFFNGNLVKY